MTRSHLTATQNMFTAAVIHADHIRHSNAENNIRRKNRKRSSEATRSWAEGLSEELKWCVHLHFTFNTGQYQSASVKTNHLCVDTRFSSASLTRVRAENSFTRLHTPTLFVSMNVCVCVCLTPSSSPPADDAPFWLPRWGWSQEGVSVIGGSPSQSRWIQSTAVYPSVSVSLSLWLRHVLILTSSASPTEQSWVSETEKLDFKRFSVTVFESDLPPVLKMRSAFGAPFGCWYRGRRSLFVLAGAGLWARDCIISTSTYIQQWIPEWAKI